MFRTILFFALCFTYFLNSNAQTFSNIKGNLLFADKKVGANVTVSLLRIADSSLVKITSSDQEGSYTIEQVSPGNFFLRLTHIGYLTTYSQPILIKAETANIVLNEIILAESEHINKELKIKSKKPAIEHRIDRTIVNVESFLSMTGTTAWDILGSSPGVRTEDKGDILLRGKAGVLILINDKPTYLGGEGLMNYLKSLPSGSIDKIELITNPPAKYDAAGKAGVINIKLKKNQVKGFNVGVSLSYGQGFFPKSNNSIQASYRTSKAHLFLNIGATYNHGFNDLFIERRFKSYDGVEKGSFKQQSDIDRKNRAANAKFGMDYQLNQKTIIGFVLSGMQQISNSHILNDGILFENFTQRDSLFKAVNDDDNYFKNGGLNLNLHHDFDSLGTSISVDADYIQFNNLGKQRYQNSIYDGNHTLSWSDQLIGRLPSKINIYSIKSDFTYSIKKLVNLESGLKISKVSTDNLVDYTNQVNGQLSPNYDLSNHFLYDETISAAYVSGSREWKKFSVQGGIRLENTLSNGHQLGNSLKPDSTFNRNYTNIFPTFYCSYKLDTNAYHEFGFNYGRRIERPIYEDLNPFVSPLDKLTFYVGNPFLKPQLANNIEFSYTYKGFLSTTLSYGYTNNMFAETIEIRGINYFSRPGNIGTNIYKSINISATLNPIKNWTCSIYTEFTQQQYKGLIYTETLDVNKPFWYANINNQFQFNKGWSAELSGFIQSTMPYAQLTLLSRKQLNIGIGKKILKNKGSLRFSIRDVFYSFINSGEINYVQDAAGSWTNKLDSRVATLSFNYNFSRGLQQKEKRKTGSAEEERNRVKNK